jgi:hypothetical protein
MQVEMLEMARREKEDMYGMGIETLMRARSAKHRKQVCV